MEHTDILIVGGGAAGMACAIKAAEAGKRVLLVERNPHPGGVLSQCIHKGFGLGYFKEDLTGTEYADRFLRRLKEALSAPAQTVLTGTTVLRVDSDKTALLSSPSGLQKIGFEKVVFASGCRERTVYSGCVSGTRPAGILTSGTAQKLMNIDHLDIGDNIVILGTGDIGQIMARQLKQNGKNVICMIEQNGQPGGRLKNRKECIEACQIPLLLHATISRIHGDRHLEAVTVRNSETGLETDIPCDVLLTAVGLIPETELADTLSEKMFGKSPDGNYPLPDWAVKTGNCDYVHDIVDSVTYEAERLIL